jgi:hypothetical protein
MCGCSGFTGNNENHFFGIKTGLFDGVRGNTFKFTANKQAERDLKVGGMVSSAMNNLDAQIAEANLQKGGEINNESPKSNNSTMLYVGIGGGILLLIVIVLVVIKMKK